MALCIEIYKTNKLTKGKAEVMFRVNGTREMRPRLHTGIYIDPEDWSEGKNKGGNAGPLKTSKACKISDARLKENSKTNERINDLAIALSKAIEAEGIGDRNAENFKKWAAHLLDKLQNPGKYAPKKAEPLTLMKIVKGVVDLVKEKKEIDGVTLTSGTITTYNQLQNYLMAFKQYKGMSEDDDFATDELTTSWYDEFTGYLSDKQGLKRNTVGKQVKVLKSILRKRIPMAQRAGCEFIVTRKCQVVRDKASDINAVFLNEQQLKVIAEQPLSPKLEIQRDLFLLQCWTGQRYGDLAKLTAENIQHTKDGKHRFFAIEQQKTHEPVAIPILPEAEAILAKYGDTMPKPWSNQKYNDAISDICHIIANTAKGREAGFNDEVEHRHNNGQLVTKERFCEAVTSHTARRSFCTNCYRRGMPIALIMSASGHQSEKVFFGYIREPLTEGRKRMVEDFFNENDERMMKQFEEMEKRVNEQ